MAKRKRRKHIKKAKDGLITLVAILMLTVMCLVLIAEKSNTSADHTNQSVSTEVSK